jgi:hypothetical protein
LRTNDATSRQMLLHPKRTLYYTVVSKLLGRFRISHGAISGLTSRRAYYFTGIWHARYTKSNGSGSVATRGRLLAGGGGVRLVADAARALAFGLDDDRGALATGGGRRCWAAAGEARLLVADAPARPMT